MCFDPVAVSIHSLLGEAQDHLSEASVSDLSKAVNNARSQSGGGSRGIGESGGSAIGNLLNLLNKVPGGPDDSVSRDINDLSRAPPGGAENMSPEEMYAVRVYATGTRQQHSG